GILKIFSSMTLPANHAGSVILENIFNIPGLGRLLFASFTSGDWQVLYSIIFVVAMITTLGYALGDLMHSKYNPKTQTLLNA
nr:hypothetical protein [Saprospiraceae bacterium]